MKKLYRSAKTGRIVTKKYAKQNPETTVAHKKRKTDKNKQIQLSEFLITINSNLKDVVQMLDIVIGKIESESK